MGPIIFWAICLIACVGYGSYRIRKLFTGEVVDVTEYMKHGTMLIAYSALVVGAASSLKAAITKHQLSAGEISMFWISVQSISELLQYLAPFVFAAIGVNMISHALTCKKV